MQRVPQPAHHPPSQHHSIIGRSRESEAKRQTGDRLTFYPAYCFKASETFKIWVKLTARDIHLVLRPHDKYTDVSTDGGDRSGLLLFYLNHPIQFVQVVGVVLVVEEYFEKFWLFKLDDSSGETIDVYCPKPPKPGKDDPNASRLKSNLEDPSRHAAVGPREHEDPESAALYALYATISKVAVGTVVQAKGTLMTFRSTRQLHLIRLSIVSTTEQELTIISSRNKFLSDTLCKPWELSGRRQKALLLDAQGEHEGHNQRERDRSKRRDRMRQREERHARRIQRKYDCEEEERKKAAERARREAEKMQSRGIQSRCGG